MLELCQNDNLPQLSSEPCGLWAFLHEDAPTCRNPSPSHLLIPSFAHPTSLNLEVVDAGKFFLPLNPGHVSFPRVSPHDGCLLSFCNCLYFPELLTKLHKTGRKELCFVSRCLAQFLTFRNCTINVRQMDACRGRSQ